MTNLADAANEYLEKRSQIGPPAAAALVMRKHGIDSLALAEYLRDHGALLREQATAMTSAASEVRYLRAEDRHEPSRLVSSIAAALERAR